MENLRQYERVFKAGQWKAQCFRCGFDFHSDELKMEWTGQRTCKDCWEPRHPMDFFQGKADDPSTAWSQPAPAEVELTTNEVQPEDL